jgi:hypothetical protein
MKTEELREVFELCKELGVSSIDIGKDHVKATFFKDDDGDGRSGALDAEAASMDPINTSAIKEKPKHEGPYPNDVFPDGEAPTF